MPEFSFNVVTMTLTEADGVVTNTINIEGTADGFGAVVGTVVAHPVAHPSGGYTAVFANFPETGDQVTATGHGEWSKIAWDRWTTAGASKLSAGEELKHEGVFDLTSRTWSGTFG